MPAPGVASQGTLHQVLGTAANGLPGLGRSVDEALCHGAGRAGEIRSLACLLAPLGTPAPRQRRAWERRGHKGQGAAARVPVGPCPSCLVRPAISFLAATSRPLGRYGGTSPMTWDAAMNKLQLDPPLGGWAPPQFVVKAERTARGPRPWTWAIYEEGRAEPYRCSTQFYRSADEAWAVGRAMLDRLGKPTDRMVTAPHRNAAVSLRPLST
jgi:hypothetical protein